MATQPIVDTRGLWRESALSTRTLSTASIFPPTDPDTPVNDYPSRKSTLTAIPDLTTDPDHEMIDTPLSDNPQSTTYQPPSSSLPSTVVNSPLFRLPRELRQAIFSYALTSPLGINFPTTTLDRSLQPQLLRLCRAVHAETAPLLYGANKLIFSHPSDANVFRHALADTRATSAHLSALILRIKNTDARLWTAYFNSLAPERSLVKDFPALRILFVRFRGPRYMPHFGPEQNVVNWLRDGKFVEIVPAVRKCRRSGTGMLGRRWWRGWRERRWGRVGR
ncbi:hypothetical protein K461DRAFT_271970 [Myriangium duriaei CBS 260.36]|uniref:F-box domain-containing protein n=1 Tax=Myriangium duriaei CBS 260.36 TaxID=1168546 RepID=A0A9P4IU72_9PEZI|nr:hypothetical protein K461DRAFT_271970 [Myriangium duriaei CBS 260.36]